MKDKKFRKALDEIRLVHKDDNGLQRRASIIENALKDAEKYKKALEIIKPFLEANDYLFLWKVGFIKGTPEEYELLKEVLK